MIKLREKIFLIDFIVLNNHQNNSKTITILYDLNNQIIVSTNVDKFIDNT